MAWPDLTSGGMVPFVQSRTNGLTLSPCDMIDRYKILEQLGEGGAGSVYKAWDKKLQRFVAIKRLLPPGQRQSEGVGDNLAAEAAALSALQHPNIVSVYDLDTDGEEPFVVMEFINGETLESTVRRGALLPADFQQIAAETLEGLIAAERQGMCHRDIKPSNLMFHWLTDGKWQTKVLDFGLANFGLRPAQQEMAGEGKVAGSVYFMAPEQFLHQPLDVRTDLYSLGCVLYYSLTGSFPCAGATVEEVVNAHLTRQLTPLQPLRPDIPPLLTDWVMWLMSRQPEERPESAAEALRVLRGIQSEQLTTLPRPRGLKTQPVPATGVATRSLTQDTADRRPSGSTAAVAVPRLAAPAPVRQRTPAKKKHPRPPGSKKSLLIAVIAVAALAVAGGIYLWTKKGAKTGTLAGVPAPVEFPGGPPEKGLLIWLDASRGARKDNGTAPASPGDRVDHWDDRATLAGNNAAQYHTSATKQPERELRRPALARLTDQGGLKGTHDVMRFNGENCLVAGRDRDKVGDPAGKELSGNKLTWIVVFSAAAGPGSQCLLCARVGNEVRAWDTFVRDGMIYSGVRKAGGAENHASLAFNAKAGFHIVAVVWDGPHDRLREWITAPDGRTTQSTAINSTTDFGELSEIRIGALNSPSGSPTNFLKGDIASLIIYNRALEDPDREAAVDYLSRRYFGIPAVKP